MKRRSRKNSLIVGVLVVDSTSPDLGAKLELATRFVPSIETQYGMSASWFAQAVDEEGRIRATATSWSYLRAFESACEKAGCDSHDFRLDRHDRGKYIFVHKDFEFTDE